MTYNFRDRTGERYGILTVQERVRDAVYPSGKLVRWRCMCDCGQETIVIGSNLSKTKSCGCQMHQGQNLRDLTGKRFGMLTVLGRAPSQELPCGQKQTMWECRCDCGSIVQVRGTHIKDGLTRSCGCVKSHGERAVAECLSAQDIKFTREFEFQDCVNANGNRLRFDFALWNGDTLSGLIEYQGEQHYEPIGRNHEFGRMQREETDAIKKEYCLTHNIPLFEIKYDEDIPNSIQTIIKMLHDNTVPSVS